MRRSLRRTSLPVVAVLLVAAGATGIEVLEQRARTAEPLPLERLFDNRAVSDDSSPGAADFDGAGNSLSARDLRTAGWRPGTRLDLDAAALRWPDRRPGTPDNVRANGQHLRLHGAGNAVSFLVAATSPGKAGSGVRGTGTVHYRNGSRSSYTLAAPDWRGGPLATKAVALPHINAGDGQLTEKAKLYAVAVPVRKGARVASVELPRDPGPHADLHVFAASVRDGSRGWTGSWSASTAGYPPVGRWRDQTLRLVVHSSTGGPRARVRLENTFAGKPVDIGNVSVALQGKGAGTRGAPVPLAFGGRAGTRIPAGARAVSDPVGFTVPPDRNLLVSIHLPGPVSAAPVHSTPVQRSYLSAGGSGDRTGDTGGGAFTGTLANWPFLTGVDVSGGPGSIVALGDSMTDGVGSTADANRRWTDVLARRLLGQSSVPHYGVLNHGVPSGRLLTDRYPGDGIRRATGGVSTEHRLERDALAQPNVRTIVLFEGINDLLLNASSDEVVAAMRSIAERARERGIRVAGATLTPCGGFRDCNPVIEQRRRAINHFIRHSGGAFDTVLDFDAVLRDPEHPQRMLPAYDSGDHLHPGDAGLRALGESVPLGSLTP